MSGRPSADRHGGPGADRHGRPGGGIGSGFRRLFRIGRILHRDVERDLDDELAFHFDHTVDDLVAGGMPPERAREEARRRFGDERSWRRELERIDRGATTHRRLTERILAITDDVRFALRGLLRSPGFTGAIVLTFALGLGANATMFGILDRLLLSPPEHIEAPDRVKRIMAHSAPRAGVERPPREALAYPDYRDFAEVGAFESVAGYARGHDIALGRGEDARAVDAGIVTASFWEVLGVRPALGRFFTAEEDQPGRPGTAVIGHGFWQREYGGRLDALGRSVDFGFGPYTIVGVAPRGFTGVNLEPVDLWLPLHPVVVVQRGPEILDSRNWTWLRVVARLVPGADADRAGAEATAIHRHARAEQIDAGNYSAETRVLAAPLIAARGPLASGESSVARWLAGVSLIVLLVACANVANLLLARTMRRRREIGVRLALGVSRGRLVRQALLESVLLGLAGAAAALAVTHWGGDLVRRLLLPGVSWTGSPAGGRVLAFVAGAAVLTGLISGLIPAIQASRPGLTEALKAGSRTLTGGGRRTRGTLTVAQAAFSVLLLVGAGLFVASLRHVQSLDLGVKPDGLLIVGLIGASALPDDEQHRLHARVDERLGALPLVEHASPVVGLPFYSTSVTALGVPGLDSVPRLPDTGLPAINLGDAEMLAALGLEVRRGRGLTAEDVEGAPRVAVVNETMARTIWPGEDAIGKCLRIGAYDAPCSEVVGVVENARQQQLIEPPSMQYYVPLAQRAVDWPPEALLVRVRGDERAAVEVIRREILSAEPALRFADVRPVRELVDRQARSWQLGATLFSAFGLLALLVAGIGIYSVLAFDVAQRTREIGIRSALGATRERVVRLVLGQGLRLAGLGTLLGALAAFLLAPRIQDLLFQTDARDPRMYAVVAASLLLVAALASVLPALRATRVQPGEALQAE